MLTESANTFDLLGSIPDINGLIRESADLGSLDEPRSTRWDEIGSIITNTIENGSSAGRSIGTKIVEDLGLDLGDVDFSLESMGIEIGRDRQASIAREEENSRMELESFGDLGLDLSDGPLTMPKEAVEGAMDQDMPMMDADALGLDLGDEPLVLDAPKTPKPLPPRQRDSESPLSEIGDEAASLYETSFRETSLLDTHHDEGSFLRVPKLKKRKIIQMDSTLELQNRQIKQQQTDRSGILRPASFLPKDPILLALLTLQKNGGFVNSILRDGRNMGWAPELRNVLSVEVVQRASSLKRKRDSGVADLSSDDGKVVELNINEDEPTMAGGLIPQDDSSILPGGPVEQLADLRDTTLDRDLELADSMPLPDFDETAMPLVHPEDSGPVSIGTQHAVHILRAQFGPEGENSPGHRQKSSLLLQDIIPQGRTNRRDATKMFFEVLVLATKDAVKVEQDPKGPIGGPIRLRAKRGLWGSWAEEKTGGTQMQTQEAAEAGAEVVEAAA